METPTKDDIQTLITKILHATTLEEVVDIYNLSSSYKQILKSIHPDKCDLPDANSAFQHIVGLKDSFDKKRKSETFEYINDAGTCIIQGNKIIQYGNPLLLRASYNNYLQLMSFTDETARHFQRYLPKHMVLHEDKLEITLEHRSVSASCITLPQEHVNWVVSRIFEILSWFENIGYVHCDINPESILIVPETHGIIISSFFFMTPKGHELTAISERYSSWLNMDVIQKRKAIHSIDIRGCKKTGLYLLGDLSGEGTELLATHNTQYIQFMMEQETNKVFDSYDAYRAILRRNFDIKKYYPLYI